jgi:hypothetical protein
MGIKVLAIFGLLIDRRGFFVKRAGCGGWKVVRG